MGEALHHGQIVDSRVRSSGKSITFVANTLGHGRKWYYDTVAKTEIPFEIILEIGAVIKYDFSSDIPELEIYSTQNLLNKKNKALPSDVQSYIKELDKWKSEAYLLSSRLLKNEKEKHSLEMRIKDLEAELLAIKNQSASK